MVAMHDCAIQPWMTIKKTQISAQHGFLEPVFLGMYRVIILEYLDVQDKWWPCMHIPLYTHRYIAQETRARPKSLFS